MASVDDEIPILSCVDTSAVYRLVLQIGEDAYGFPERTAYVRELLARTAKDLRETAKFIEERLREQKEDRVPPPVSRRR